MKLESFAERHDELLNRLILLNESILELDKKIQSLVENIEWSLVWHDDLDTSQEEEYKERPK